MQGHVRVLSGLLIPTSQPTQSCHLTPGGASARRNAPHPAAPLHSLMQNRAINIYTQPASENQEPASCKDWGRHLQAL